MVRVLVVLVCEWAYDIGGVWLGSYECGYGVDVMVVE